jgi:hypothetical protein
VRRRAVALAVLAAATPAAGCGSSGPPAGLPSCGPAPTSDGPAAGRLVATVEKSPASVPRTGRIDVTVALRAETGSVPFQGGIPLGLELLARNKVVGTYRGSVTGTERTASVTTAGITFTVRGAITACAGADTIGSGRLPAGHYDLVATIAQSVGGEPHTIVSGRRKVRLTDGS